MDSAGFLATGAQLTLVSRSMGYDVAHRFPKTVLYQTELHPEEYLLKTASYEFARETEVYHESMDWG